MVRLADRYRILFMNTGLNTVMSWFSVVRLLCFMIDRRTVRCCTAGGCRRERLLCAVCATPCQRSPVVLAVALRFPYSTH